MPGAYEQGFIRLNANESPWRAPGDTSERGLNVYPPPRPFALRRKLAEHYGAREQDVLVTRGSSEAIDTLIRGFCEARRDSILITPPTFDMYRLYAGIQGAEVLRVPLRVERDRFVLDVERVLDAVGGADGRRGEGRRHSKVTTILVGQAAARVRPKSSLSARRTIRPDSRCRGRIVESVCASLAGRALVVIDEAYHEFASGESFPGSAATLRARRAVADALEIRVAGRRAVRRLIGAARA